MTIAPCSCHRRFGLLVACWLFITVGPSEAAAQGRTSGPAEDYRLSMPVLRRALPVLYAPGQRRCSERQREPREVAAMSVGEMQAEIERCAPIRRAAAAQGISSRELAQVSKALMQAAMRMAEEDGAKATGGTPAPLAAGALRDNVAFLRQNDAELRTLTKQAD